MRGGAGDRDDVVFELGLAADRADGEPVVPVLKRRAGMKTDKYFSLNITTSEHIPISKTTKKDSESADSESFLWLRGWDLNHTTSGL